MKLSIIILAAGQGTRMCSGMPKVLHPLGGRPLLAHVIDTAHALDAADIHVVIGHGAESVREAFADAGVQWVMQEQQLGTGHAVAQAMPGIEDDHVVLVMYGDVPLVRDDTLRPLCATAAQGFVGVLTAYSAPCRWQYQWHHRGEGCPEFRTQYPRNQYRFPGCTGGRIASLGGCAG
jgi:bifunctional UDP-N-acetylglucosamine pyrophosphorylase/glucosamine-1-phosphate N-acetyltransferase